jgi:D-ala D-ala ligase C-terminus
VPDAKLNERLKSMAMRTFAAMPGARGYARIDVRSDASGENLYFLEINPNCGIFYPQGLYGSADFILDRADPICGHADLLLNQVKVAQILHKQQQQNAANDGTDDGRNLYEARYDGVQESWGLYAIRDIDQGEIIQWNEEKPVHLVSKSHVLRHWNGAPDSDDPSVEKKNTTTTAAASAIMAHTTWDNFTAYCWPVNDSLFAMWDPDPNRWAPINHSCDPNAWNETGNGLNIGA